MKRPLSLLAATLCAAVASGCAATGTDDLTAASPRAQIFSGLGTRTRPVSTTSREAQAFFDQGLTWMYAFNHDEAIRSFSRAAELDPECAMAWWGVAICEGPNYNDPVMTEERSAAAWAALQEARARLGGTTPVERALIEAQGARLPHTLWKLHYQIGTMSWWPRACASPSRRRSGPAGCPSSGGRCGSSRSR